MRVAAIYRFRRPDMDIFSGEDTMQAKANVLMKTLVISCLLATFMVAGCSKEEVEAPPIIRPVKVLEVGSLEQGLSRSFPGQVVANLSVELAFRVPGQIEKWPINEGQKMKKCETVAQLDQRDFKAALGRVQAQYSGAVASRKEAAANLKRAEQLLPSGAIAQATYDEMEAVYENARARESSIGQEIRKAKLDVEYTTLRAPFDGIVSAKYVENFENVKAQQPVIKYEDIESVDIVIEIPEFVWGRVSRAQSQGKKAATSLIASFGAHPDRGFQVSVKEFQTTANPETQTYSVKLTMEQPDDFTVYPGMTAKVDAELADISAAGFSVPIQAVFGDNDGKKFVWIVGDDMVVKMIPVTTGEMSGSDISISKGLKGGEKVVIAGVNTLLPDSKVTILGEKE